MLITLICHFICKFYILHPESKNQNNPYSSKIFGDEEYGLYS